MSEKPTLIEDLEHAAELAHFAALHAGTLPSAAEARFRDYSRRLREEMERKRRVAFDGQAHTTDEYELLVRINGGPLVTP